MWLKRKIGSNEFRSHNSALQITFIAGHTLFLGWWIPLISIKLTVWFGRYVHNSVNIDINRLTVDFHRDGRGKILFWSLSYKNGSLPLKTLFCITFCYQPHSSSTKHLVAVVYILGMLTLKYTEFKLKCSICSLKTWEVILDWSLLLFKF